jgi:hypothetical protein
VARRANNKAHEASPQSAEMETQTSMPMTELSVGLQNINNTNKLPRVMSYLKLYLSHVLLLAFFFHGSIALVGLGLHIFEASW